MVLTLAGRGLADGERFSQSITPEDFAAAGLNRLSPAELSRLDALIAAQKNTANASSRRSTVQTPVPKKSTETESKATSAEARTPQKDDRAVAPKTSVVVMPGTKIEYAVIRSTIPGEFHGWDDRTVFVLANGQYWQVANGGRYYSPTKQDVEVEITPSALGGFWMSFPALKAQVRVRLLADK